MTAAERLVRELRARSEANPIEGRIREASAMLLEVMEEEARDVAASVDGRFDPFEALGRVTASGFPEAIVFSGTLVGMSGHGVDDDELQQAAAEVFAGLMERERSRRHGGPFKGGDVVWCRAMGGWTEGVVAELANNMVVVEFPWIEDPPYESYPVRHVRMGDLRAKTGKSPPDEDPA